MPEYESFSVTVEDGIAELHLSRPDVLNRFDDTLHEELGPVITALGANVDVRCILWTSSGRQFSAGGDTEIMMQAHNDIEYRFQSVDQGRALFRSFADLSKPLVVALHGGVYGLAATLVLTADALVSAPGVRIADPHVKFALVAGDGGSVMWPAQLPLIKAKRHLLTGEPLLAEEAHGLGVVTDLAESVDEVRPLALGLARQLAALPPLAVQMTKRALNQVLQARLNEAFDLAFYLEAMSTATEDVAEAVAAFKDRREPVWKGR